MKENVFTAGVNGHGALKDSPANGTSASIAELMSGW
jgi:hypothetical protein